MKTKRRRKEPILPPAAFLQCAVPFALPIAGSLIVAATIGDAWPRAIAPGSGLKLAGLVITCLTAAGVWRWTTHRLESAPSRKFVALMCAMTGLLGWPAWSAGVLPSINGMSLGPDRVEQASLSRLEATPQGRGRRGYYHWAWLQPLRQPSAIGPGRMFIPETVYAKWNVEKPGIVTLRHATGLLGAEVMTGFDGYRDDPG